LLFVGGTREPGGVQVHTSDVAQAAAALGCQVTIASMSFDFFSSLVAGSAVTVEMAERLCIEEKLHRPRRTILRRYRAWSELMARHRGSDVVLVEGSLAQTPAGELPMVRRAGGRFYAIAHSAGMPRKESPLRRRIHGGLLRHGLHRLIAVSPQIRDTARDSFGLPEDRIAVCTNWISPAFNPPNPVLRAEARRRLGLEESVLVLGYVGRLSGDKLGETMLNAFAQALRTSAREIRLIIAGDGWKADEWREIARNLGIARRVHFAGWQNEPARIYHALDVFLLPSLAEGFPLGVMEAMACGVPGLVHPMGSTLALVEHGRTGFVADMNSPASLAEAIGAIAARGPGELAAMGQRAAAHIREHHSRERRLPAVLGALDIPLEGRALPPALLHRLQFRPWDSAV
jgi:glycosyltransferase involved in cell wall biosynthesis